MQRICGAGLLLTLGVTAPAAADDAGFVDRFKSAGSWHVAEYDFSHPHFDTDWRKARAVFGDGLTLTLGPHDAGLNRFVGGSVRREVSTHYGRYEAVIQPARGDGLITGFFTYTGPHYGTRHDEIDIEFLGRDTTVMNIAWFVNGAMTDHRVPLGFDAADRPRLYAFEWLPDRLRWYAEDSLIFEHHIRDGAIPTVPGRLFANLWAADPMLAAWSGVPQPGTTGQAWFDDVRFVPLQPLAPQEIAQKRP